ncbi:MAG: hypothetical protein WAW34_11775 [Rhodoferax sp.]
MDEVVQVHQIAHIEHRLMVRVLAPAISMAVSFLLFLFGIDFPLNLRVRGDAYGYLEIASRLSDFTSIYQYSGDRAIGFPLIEFLIHGVISWFFSSVNLTQWVNAICVVLYTVHMTASWLFSKWMKSTLVIKSEYSGYFMFFFLATYPAMVGYTTTPLSDTLAIDFMLLALVFFDSALNNERRYGWFTLSISAAVFLGFSILVRPALILGLAIALTVCGGISICVGTRRIQVTIGTIIVASILILAPYLANCKSTYGSYCLQSPKTFDANLSIQEGLRGARISWSKIAKETEKLPMIDDSLMYNSYYKECNIEGLFGLQRLSLTGCLLARPLSAPPFVVKKWIGLFDHFRFTPYLENLTPPWLRLLSRVYGAFAWLGLSLSFLIFLKFKETAAKSNLQMLLTQNISLVLLASCSIVLLAQHTVLHTEDRYGFPIVPICAALAIAQLEHFLALYRKYGWRRLVWRVTYCLLALAMFAYQTTSWDQALIAQIG